MVEDSPPDAIPARFVSLCVLVADSGLFWPPSVLLHRNLIATFPRPGATHRHTLGDRAR